MRALVVYDSTYGNTEQIANAIGAPVLRVGEVDPADLEGADLLIVGSPTHGGFPTEGVHGLLTASLALEEVSVAAFDTRTRRTIFGYAGPKIARSLEENGGTLLAPPEGFFVRGKRGPLKDGERERAAEWTKRLLHETGESDEIS